MAEIILTAPWQKRKGAIVHPLLMLAAQMKADDMAQKSYYSHTSPSGETPNEIVRRAGYRLPGGYAKRGNNVESIASNGPDIQKVVQSWLDSPSHRDHVAGANAFYVEQTAVGVGTAINKGGWHLWVFLSAHNVG